MMLTHVLSRSRTRAVSSKTGRDEEPGLSPRVSCARRPFGRQSERPTDAPCGVRSGSPWAPSGAAAEAQHNGSDEPL